MKENDKPIPDLKTKKTIPRQVIEALGKE